MGRVGAYIGAGCDASSCEMGAGALEGNSGSESTSSNISSSLTLLVSAVAAAGTSSMATSWVSGSGLTLSVCDASCVGVESGEVECGIVDTMD